MGMIRSQTNLTGLTYNEVTLGDPVAPAGPHRQRRPKRKGMTMIDHLDECWWVTDHGWPCICDRIRAGQERLRSDIRAAVDSLGRDSTQTRRTLISSVLTAIDDPHRYI